MELEVIEYINECTIVAGQINKQNFLFKNRDKTFHGRYKIIHEIFHGVEMVYATDDTDWVEGINQFGIGFIMSFLKTNKKHDMISKRDSKSFKFLNRDLLNEYDDKINDFKHFLTAKTPKEAVGYVESAKWNGNYFIGGVDEVYSVEVYKKSVVTKKLDLTEGKYSVRTNYGLETGGGYSLNSKYNIDGASAFLRKYGAEKNLNGFKNYVDVIKKMSFQEYDTKSPLNVFKTTNTDMTVAQYFLDLVNKIFVYVVSKKNGNFFGIEDKIPKHHNKVISIIIKKQEEIEKEENGWEIFKSKLK